MISPLCTDEELIRAAGYLSNPQVKVLADRLKLRRQQITQAVAILERGDPDLKNRVDHAVHVLTIEL